MSDGTSRTGYVPGIEGLRAVAVLSVLLYHLDHKLLPGGFAGVDVFFVISGYVISRSLYASNAATLGAFILAFYKRRILRLLPALLVFLFATSLVCAFFIPDSWLSGANNETALWAFFGLSNFYLVHSADGYFSERVAFNPFLHTWSLAVEEQFYLLFPLLFYVWLKRGTPRPASHVPPISRLLSALAVGSLLLAVYETRASPSSAFYLLPSRFWELAAGALLFQAERALPGYHALAKSSWLLLVGIACLLFAFLYTAALPVPFPGAVVPVAGTVLLIAGLGGAPAGSIRAFLESRVLTYVGRMSYSIYLWHWGVFVLFRWTIGVSEPLTAVTAVLLTLTLAALSYHVLEQPFRRHHFFRRQPSWRVAAAGVGAVLIAHLSIGSLYERRNALGFNLSVTTNVYDWTPYYWSPLDPSSRKHLFVIGDSNAYAYSNMVYSAAREVGANVYIFSRYGCPLTNLRDSVVETYPHCRDIEREVIAYLQANANPGDIVFIASLRVPRLSAASGPVDLEKQLLSRHNHPEQIERRQRGFREAARFIEKLQAMKLHVILDAPRPVFRAPPFRCSDWFNRSNPACRAGFSMSRQILLEHREPIMVALRKLESSLGVHVWDPFPILCPGAACSAFDGNKPLFFDADHLSGHGGRLLVPSFTAEIERIWKEAPAEPPGRRAGAVSP